MTASSSTSITASWQLPPTDSRNGIITGFNLFYRKKSSGGSTSIIIINNGTIRTKVVTGLDKYTEYEFQVLGFTSVGDGTNSSVVVERTKEDGKDSELVIKLCTSFKLVTRCLVSRQWRLGEMFQFHFCNMLNLQRRS